MELEPSQQVPAWLLPAAAAVAAGDDSEKSSGDEYFEDSSPTGGGLSAVPAAAQTARQRSAEEREARRRAEEEELAEVSSGSEMSAEVLRVEAEIVETLYSFGVPRSVPVDRVREVLRHHDGSAQPAFAELCCP
eukprot:SAG11_NODE_1123_length_5778_cov_4.474027_3_plen_134_part_00